jgi:hypothetical protein
MMVIPRAIFLQMAGGTTIRKRLLKLHQMRPALLQCGWVKELPLQTIDRLAEKLEANKGNAESEAICYVWELITASETYHIQIISGICPTQAIIIASGKLVHIGLHP